MTVTPPDLSESLENYLETILVLEREHGVARSKDIARHLGVNRSSVTGALQALGERGLVNYEPYGFVTLTPAGTSAAQRIWRRHEIWRDFMVGVLGVDAAEADAVACRMEHGVSKPVVDRLVEFADFVASCPRAGASWVRAFRDRCEDGGTPGASCEACVTRCLTDARRRQANGKEATSMQLSLGDLKPGERGMIERVAGAGAVKRRVRDMGVTTGSLVEVVRVAPLGDPIEIKVKGYHLSLRKEEAADIAVRKVE